MTRADAIAFIKDIQTGSKSADDFDDEATGLLELRGWAAESLWEDEVFRYGMEYGAIAALMIAFNITAEDL